MTDVLVSARAALDQVFDPELDEPITELGFVRSLELSGDTLVVHLRLPTSFCSPNFAYLMASDAKDALRGLAPHVVVELDDHHDSSLINGGLARDAGYKGTFGVEAEESLDELRLTFRRKAHTAAMERALTVLLRSGAATESSLHLVRLGDLPAGKERTALLARRAALGYRCDPSAVVLLDPTGEPVSAADAATVLRKARSVRISVDGNAHFCRGLLLTRYPDSAADQTPRADELHPALPLLVKANA